MKLTAYLNEVWSYIFTDHYNFIIINVTDFEIFNLLRWLEYFFFFHFLMYKSFFTIGEQFLLWYFGRLSQVWVRPIEKGSRDVTKIYPQTNFNQIMPHRSGLADKHQSINNFITQQKFKTGISMKITFM